MAVDIPGRAATEDWQTDVRDQTLGHERVDKRSAVVKQEKVTLPPGQRRWAIVEPFIEPGLG